MSEAALRKHLLNKVHRLKAILKYLKDLLIERLIGVEEPLPDEVEAIKEYESEKKRDKIELIKLEDILKGLQ